MPIPKNIHREHIVKAIRYIDEHGVPSKNESTKYNLHFNNKMYPPKYVVSKANIYANGRELDVSGFSGGDETNSVLQGLGFEIIQLFNEVPPLEPKLRAREYESYSDAIRDRIVFDYLFHSQTHRWLDEHIIGLNADESRGYQAMGILHYIGLRDKHKGIFKGSTVLTALVQLRNSKHDFSVVIASLERTSADYNSTRIGIVDAESEKTEYEEGKELLKLHRIRERDPQLIKDAKRRFKKLHGELFCEACGINFEKVYGERGKDFIECHHKKPISIMKEGETTKVEDMSMLCANCHRMIHRIPMISVEELKKSLRICWKGIS
ncbi:HNH endonuclease [Paenibacillus polymyxa]|uniref:HNH endonuclease n=1 Tax=Paenibacillus polymyxa TaxID=1406 RepID=UPI002378EB61|nr:HNH endonuclease [Paenibacillus polymyxa]